MVDLEDELRDLRDDLTSARDELRAKESDKSRIVDEDRWLMGCLRLQNRIEALEAEERKLVADLEAE